MVFCFGDSCFQQSNHCSMITVSVFIFVGVDDCVGVSYWRGSSEDGARGGTL